MKKEQEELRTTMNSKGFITNKDLTELVYFKALVKKTVRLHPSAPLLIVRETICKGIIKGYDMLPKTLAYVNGWAIRRDPQS
ncbi:Cytochrome P450 71B28 [Bienertia sinuspersici]